MPRYDEPLTEVELEELEAEFRDNEKVMRLVCELRKRRETEYDDCLE